MASTGTTLDLTLTDDFLGGGILNTGSGIAGQDVQVYGVLFDTSGFVSETTLVNDGTIVGGATVAGGIDYAISLVANGGTLNGGKFYIVVESGTADISGSITNQAFLSSSNATTYDFAYDSFEATLLGTATDAANLTSVNGFALPMGLSVSLNGTTSSVGYAVPGSTIVSDITQSVSLANAGTNVTNTFTAGGLSGQFRMAVSPTAVNQPGTAASTTDPYPQAGWDTYVAAMETIAPDVTIAGLFNGAPDAAGVWHNAGYYAYSLQWDGTNFWLVPTASSQIQGAILLSPYDIEENIFSQVGSVSIYAEASTSSALLDTVGVGDNTQWGAVLAQFLTGFTAGYYGQQAEVVVNGTTQTIDLNQNYNWNPSYAFRQGTETVVNSGTGYAYDPYSQVFYAHSNSYGSPYSDLLMSHYTAGGPLLTVADSSGTDAGTISLTIYGQHETPSGYTTPTIYDTIAASGTYAAVDPTNAAGANLTFSFYAAAGVNAGIELDPSSEIIIGFEDSTGWQTVTINGAGTYVVNSETYSNVGLWHQWTIAGTAGNWTVSLDPGGSPGTLSETNSGSMTVTLPTADSGVSLYQITVGGGTAHAKTYDLYTTTGNNGLFANPNYSGQTNAQAINGLATISGPALVSQYVPTMTVNFTVGDTVTFDPSLVVENTGSNSNLPASGGFPTTLPSPPVVLVASGGTVSGNVINPGTYSANPTDAGTISVSSGDHIQLGWAGYDTSDVDVIYNTVTTTVSVTNAGTTTIQTSGTVTGYGWTGYAPIVAPILPPDPTPTQTETITIAYANGSAADSIQTITNIGSYTDKVNPYDRAVILVQNSISGTTTITVPADVDGNWLSNAYDFGIGTYTLSMYDAVDQNGTLTAVTSPSDPVILNVSAVSGAAANNQVVIACFAAGTEIATSQGRVAVECLAIGDRVLTVDGRSEAIRWLGHRTVDCARHPTPEAVRPVRISAHAFGLGLPERDLFLSPDHAIYAEGVLVPVKHLINGHTVAQQRVESVTYFHLELDHHEVVLAEGLPAESYLDTGDRASFANGGGATALHPAWGSVARDISLVFEAQAYAPLCVTGPEVARLRANLALPARNLAVA